VRVVSVHSDVVVATSAVWQTTCTIVRGGDEAFVVDSPVLPEELEALATVLSQAGFAFSGLLATHGDWDHLLGRYAFPHAALGVAETTAARLTGSPGEAQRELRDFDEEWYVRRPGPLGLGQVQALPVPGKLELGAGGVELELHPADGHTVDGMCLWVPWARVLVCGDYLSPVEIPMLSAGGSASAYLATLSRLEALVEQADWVVPGHGEPLEAARAAAILREDRAYVEGLLADPGAVSLPLARRSHEQRRIHGENVERVRGAG
jgi:glyoxylase-like metal-dependent hydrolase (beta-lactamase superfamily II)